VIGKGHADTVAALGHESAKRVRSARRPAEDTTPAELAALLRADAEKWAPDRPAAWRLRCSMR